MCNLTEIRFICQIENNSTMTTNKFTLIFKRKIFLIISLKIHSVDDFVCSVNSHLTTRQENERLKGIMSRIESYDVVVSFYIEESQTFHSETSVWETFLSKIYI